MKFKINGVEIDSEKGSPNLNIPPGDKLPLEAGDVIEVGELKFTVALKGIYMITPQRIYGLSV